MEQRGGGVTLPAHSYNIIEGGLLKAYDIMETGLLEVWGDITVPY